MKIVILAEKYSLGTEVIRALTDSYINKDGYMTGKCTVEPYVGDELIVTYASGHMYTLWDAKDYDEAYKSWDIKIFPCIPDKFKTKVIDEPRIKKQVRIINKLFADADLIVNCCDAEREGELIFSYIYEHSASEAPYKRLWLQAFTKASIRNAFAHMKSSEEMKHLDTAARLRAISDWLIGCNCTVFATEQFNIGKGFFSVGRVQTPALAFIARREKEIKNFVAKPFWTVKANFKTKKDESFESVLSRKNLPKSMLLDDENSENMTAFMKESNCDKVISDLNGALGKVSKIDKRKQIKEVPDLYNTISLQSAANKKFSFTAKKTLSILQSLYEKKFSSYPRTDAKWLPEDMKGPMVSVLDRFKSSEEYKKYLDGIKYQPFTAKHFNDKKLKDKGEAHYAIVPTGKIPKDSELSSDELKIFDLIAKSVIRLAYPPLEINVTTAEIKCGLYKFYATGYQFDDFAWCKVDAMPKFNIIPDMNVGDELNTKFEKCSKTTTPPPRYTDDTLGKAINGADKTITDKKLAAAIKGQGIGRPATTAELIEVLVKRQYAERKKKKFYCTEKGMSLYDQLPVEDLKSAVLTAKWEQRLKKVEQGEDDPDKFLYDMKNVTKIWCNKIADAPKSDYVKHRFEKEYLNVACPLCGKRMVVGKNFYLCEDVYNRKADGKPICDFVIPKEICKKEISKSQAELIVKNGESSNLVGLIGKSGVKFDAKLKLDKTKNMGSYTTFVFDDDKKFKK